MVTKRKKRKSTGSKKRFIGKPNGQIQERVQTAGPEHFGVVSVDCFLVKPYVLLLSVTGINVVSAARLAGEAGPIEHYASARAINGRAGLHPSRYQSDEQSIRDMNSAFSWLPKSAYAEEAKPLAELARKKRRGPQPIGDLLIPRFG